LAFGLTTVPHNNIKLTCVYNVTIVEGKRFAKTFLILVILVREKTKINNNKKINNNIIYNYYY